jgi:hypothetical protein
MALSQRITELAQAMARELKARTTSDHPGVARAWVSLTDAGDIDPAPTVLASFNITTVERIARGQYRVHFGVAMSDANYCWQAHAQHARWWICFKPGAARLQLGIKTPHYIQINCRNAIGLPVAALELNLTIWR